MLPKLKTKSCIIFSCTFTFFLGSSEASSSSISWAQTEACTDFVDTKDLTTPNHSNHKYTAPKAHLGNINYRPFGSPADFAN